MQVYIEPKHFDKIISLSTNLLNQELVQCYVIDNVVDAFGWFEVDITFDRYGNIDFLYLDPFPHHTTLKFLAEIQILVDNKN